MRIKQLTLLLLSIFLITGCDSDSGGKKKQKPPAAGKTLEVVVVIEDEMWKGIVGDTVKDYFMQDQPGLGQPEPMFNVKQINPEDFSELFRKYRNLLLLQTKKDEKKAEYKANIWAKPQHVVQLSAPGRQELANLVDKEKEKIREKFYISERKRIIKAYKRNNQDDISEKIKDSLNISMVVPKGFYLAKLEDNFAWLRRETDEMSHGIMIYTAPYVDTMQFNPDNILDLRDSVTKENIPGPIDGSYMTTERLLRPYTRDSTFNGEFAMEIRGLWKTEKAFMGGPYLNITTYDKKNRRLVTFDGFVYHPNREKRNYLMQLNAIIHSAKFIGKEDKNKDRSSKTKDKE